MAAVTTTGMLHTIRDTQSYVIVRFSQNVDTMLIRRTSTNAAITTFTPPKVRMYAACTRETMVVTMHVEKMTMRRWRRTLSSRPASSLSGAMMRMRSAITSATSKNVRSSR